MSIHNRQCACVCACVCACACVCVYEYRKALSISHINGAACVGRVLLERAVCVFKLARQICKHPDLVMGSDKAYSARKQFIYLKKNERECACTGTQKDKKCAIGTRRQCLMKKSSYLGMSDFARANKSNIYTHHARKRYNIYAYSNTYIYIYIKKRIN